MKANGSSAGPLSLNLLDKERTGVLHPKFLIVREFGYEFEVDNTISLLCLNFSQRFSDENGYFTIADETDASGWFHLS